VIYIVTMNCENGHNITAAPYEREEPPTDAWCQDVCEELQRETKADMQAGKLPLNCPHCGSRASSKWECAVTSLKPGITLAEVHKQMDEGSRIGTAEAEAAAAKRAAEKDAAFHKLMEHPAAYALEVAGLIDTPELREQYRKGNFAPGRKKDLREPPPGARLPRKPTV
jgi:hypothetical protein